MRPELATRQGGEAGRRAQQAAPAAPVVPAPRPAAPARLRLAFAGALVLFAAWLGWLAYLAVTTRTPVVLSRPQFLVSGLDVIAQLDRIDDGLQELTVMRVLWSAAAEGRELEGATVTVTNLGRCAGDWAGPGDYLIPLIPDGAGRYQVPATPLSPGLEARAARPRIYPATPATLKQYETIAKP